MNKVTKRFKQMMNFSLGISLLDVLVGMLFMSAFLIISYGSNVNKSKLANEQREIIQILYKKRHYK